MATESISPFFIVGEVTRTIAFYYEKLGFATAFRAPDDNPFFAVLPRDGVQILVKAHEGVPPQPNSSRHRFMRWDAFVSVAEPDLLAAEYSERGTPFSAPSRHG